MKNFIFLGLVAIAFGITSCASLNQSSKFVSDDLYYSNDFQHRLNQQALLLNENIAMPDSSWEYFDETYASSIRPSYANRLQNFGDTDTNTQYVSNDYEDTYADNGNNNGSWLNNVSMGVGVGVGAAYGYNAYYGGQQTNYYSNTSNSNNSVYQRNLSSSPYANTTNYNRYDVGVNSRIYTPVSTTQSTPKPYINSNPGFNPGNNTNREYRTRSDNSWSTPSNYNNSRSGGSAVPSSTIGGYHRR